MFEALRAASLHPLHGAGRCQSDRAGGWVGSLQVSQPGRSGPAAAAVTTGDAIGRWAVTLWLVGVVASAGVLLVGLARLRWLRVSSRRVTEGPWHRLCTDLARSCGLSSRRRSAVRSASGAGGDVGLAAAGGPASGVGGGVVGGADARRAAARACPRAPRRLAVADGGRSVALRLVVQPAGVGGAGAAPPRERARGRRPGAGAGRSGHHLRDTARRTRERGSEAPADVVAGAGDGASVTPGMEDCPPC